MRPLEPFEDGEGRPCQLFFTAIDDRTGETLLVYQRLKDPGVMRVMPEKEEKAPRDANACEEQEHAEETPAAETKKGQTEEIPEEEAPDPEVARFLDAKSMEEKMDVLLSMRDHITNEEIDTLAMSLGISIDEGSPEERFDDLRECLNTIARYELENARLR